MMFLLNDTVLTLDSVQPPLDPVRFRALSLDFVLKLGTEAFADRPLLHKTDPVMARRLASLIVAKAPEANAALFVAPSVHCNPDHVLSRVASLSIEVMADLYGRQARQGLTTVVADTIVWRRMAA
jgi:hypothetical protein